MLGSLFGIIEDAVKIVAAPVSIAADVVRVVTKPDAAEAIHEEVNDLIDD